MPRPYGHSYRDARILKTVANERRLHAQNRGGFGVSDLLGVSGRIYLVKFLDTCDAATDNMDGTYTLGEGEATIICRIQDNGEKNSQDPDNTITALTTGDAEDKAGDSFTKRVLNTGSSSIAADVPILAVQDVFGDLYAINPTTSSTPTTSGIPYVHDTNSDTLPCPAYGILWKSDPGFQIVSGTRYMLLARPRTIFDIHWFVNQGTPIAVGSRGVCDTLIEKPGPVRIDDSLIGTINFGDELGPKPGSFTIWPGYQGFTATGPDYAISGAPVVKCIQHPVKRVFGRLYQDLIQNADGTASIEFEIWRRDTDGKRKVSGWDKITVYGPLLNKNEKAKQGSFGWADYHTNSKATVKWEGDFACDKDDTNSNSSTVSASPGDALNGPLLADASAGTQSTPDLSVAQGTI